MQIDNLHWQIRGTYNEACASEGQCPFYLGRDNEGACHPIRLELYVHTRRLRLEYRNILIPFDVPPEVVVLGNG